MCSPASAAAAQRSQQSRRCRPHTRGCPLCDRTHPPQLTRFQLVHQRIDEDSVKKGRQNSSLWKAHRGGELSTLGTMSCDLPICRGQHAANEAKHPAVHTALDQSVEKPVTPDPVVRVPGIQERHEGVLLSLPPASQNLMQSEDLV